MPLYPYHLAAIRSTIWKARDVISTVWIGKFKKIVASLLFLFYISYFILLCPKNLFHSWHVFHTIFNGWFFTKWMTASFIRFPGLFYLNSLDGFDSSSNLYFPKSLFQVFEGLFKGNWLQLVSLSPSCFTIFSALSQNPSICQSFIFTLWSTGTKWNLVNGQLFFLVNQHWVFSQGLSYLFVSQNPREFYESHFLGWILVCVYTIWLFDQILISCKILGQSPFPPSHN